MANCESNLPSVSVIVPTHQRREMVCGLIDSLCRQDYEGSFEVIVVVDGSTDGTGSALQRLEPPFPLKIIEQPNMGAASARNRGAREARGEILLFIDDDMRTAPDLISEHYRSHRAGADVVIGHMPLDPASRHSLLTDSISKWADDRFARLSQADAEIPLHDLLTGQLSVQRQAFEATGGFDSRFTHGGSFGNEDIDFGHRIIAGGYRVAFNPRATTWQRYEVDPHEYLRRARETGHADVLFARKHPERRHAIFQYLGDGKWINRAFWRRAVEVSFAAAPLIHLVDFLTARMLAGGHRGALASKLFSWSSAIQYWVGVREAGGIPRHKTLRVISYHAISDLAGMPIVEEYGVPPDKFRRQLETLEESGFHFISADEFERFLRGNCGLPSRALLLTFDDCYTDLLDNALPILEEKKIPAIAFAVSRLLGDTNAWDRGIGAPQLPLLDATQLAELASRGVEIGSHSRTHPLLPDADDEALATEMSGSMDDLQAIGITRPRFLAYPFGAHDARVRRAAKRANFSAAFTVEPMAFRVTDDAMQIPRIEIMRSDSGRSLLLKVGFVPFLRRAVRW